MSGGMKITDHGDYKSPKDQPLPVGNKVKHYSSAEGAGHEGYYEDTTEAIKSAQEMGDRKVKSHPMKDGFRN